MIGHREAVFWGLMHDAAEAYYGDMISPLKALIPEFETFENRGAEAIRDKFSIPYDSGINHTVHIADKTLASLEGDAITTVPSSLWDTRYTAPYDIFSLDPDFHVWGPKKARTEFLKAFHTFTS